MSRPLTILVCALGGEGGGVLSEWLVDAALAAGYPVQSTSVPGVAQRTGATTYYLEILPLPAAGLGGRRPVFSLYPVPGALDLLVSSELLETARQIGAGMATAERTQVVSSTARTLTTNERMQLGDGRMPAEPLLETVRRHSRSHHLLDMGKVARESGTVVSAVMFGAIAGSGVLPFGREVCEQVIRAGGKGAEASLRGFDRAFTLVATARGRGGFVAQMLGGLDGTGRSNGAVSSGAASRQGAPHEGPAPGPMSNEASSNAASSDRAADAFGPGSLTSPGTPSTTTLPAAAAGRFDATVHDIVALGHARLVDYQDRAYADLYLERLARVHDAERAGDPQGRGAGRITRETARFLALWMAFDDIVRVADLKARASRRERVAREVKVRDGELLRVYDHFKPGVAEVAALLPPALSDALLRWERRRTARGAAPLAWPLKIARHGVVGIVALRVLAGMRGLRRRGARFALEQRLIERWLAAIEHGTRLDAALGHEIALCGRLIKGYGSTNERGKANLLHVVDHLAPSGVAGAAGAAARDASADAPIDAPAAAAAIRAAREAALADDTGVALDRALREQGAPARPVVEAPIRFVRRPKHVASAGGASGTGPY